MDLPFESLPQREAKQRRRRKGGSNEEAPEQPGEQPGPSSSAAEAGAARAAAASTPTGDLAGAAAAALNGLALHERAQPGASTSAPAGADEGLPRLRYTECPEYRSCAVGGNKYEYLDHTADVQLHAWGATLEEAFGNAGLAMFNYMTPLEGIAIDPGQTRVYEASGHDLQSLLYAFLDELLFVFATELLVCKELDVARIDREAWTIRAVGRGEHFERGRHEAGTEVKAITYSAMQIREDAASGDAEVFVIVDI